MKWIKIYTDRLKETEGTLVKESKTTDPFFKKVVFVDIDFFRVCGQSLTVSVIYSAELLTKTQAAPEE